MKHLTRYHKWMNKHLSPLDGKHAVVTGGNSGIGFAAAELLLALGAKVTLACRSAERGERAAQSLRAGFPGALVRVELLDLAERASIDAFAQNMRGRGEKIDVLLHCAGVYYPREQETRDGLPATVGVNYQGTVWLTEQLLDLMDAEGRVIFTTSLVDRFGKLREAKKRPSQKEGYAEYARSKLLLSAYALSCARARGAHQPAFIAVHPGITATSLLDPAKTSHNPLFSRLGHSFLFLFTHKKEKAALTALLAAAGKVKNGDCIGPRGFFGISGYPHRTRFCRKVRRLAD